MSSLEQSRRMERARNSYDTLLMKATDGLNEDTANDPFNRTQSTHGTDYTSPFKLLSKCIYFIDKTWIDPYIILYSIILARDSGNFQSEVQGMLQEPLFSEADKDSTIIALQVYHLYELQTVHILKKTCFNDRKKYFAFEQRWTV
jgi:hypothetical protein